MASGVLINDGQQWCIDRLAGAVNASGGLYVGLMTSHNTPTPWSAQLPTDIEEITGSNYSRQLSASWTVISGTNPYMQGAQVTFNVSGTWSDVYGYFVAQTSGNSDALWTELFPTAYRGDKFGGDSILITPKFEIKDENE